MRTQKLPLAIFTLALSLTIFGAITVSPKQTFATCTPTPSSGDGSNNNTSYCMLAPLPGIGENDQPVDVSTGFGTYLNSMIKLIMGLIGVFAVLMCVVGGIEYMSTVSVGEKEGAKNRIVNALFGVVLALASYLILNTINPRLIGGSISVGSSTTH
jgi:hypothetical protein